MNVCLIGNSLTSLILAKALVNNKIKVSLYYEYKKKISSSVRTIGISDNNLKFIINKIIKIKSNLVWSINQIEIFDELINNNKILTFKKNSKKLFHIIKNEDLFIKLNNNLIKTNNFKKIKIKSKSFYTQILSNKKYDLIINCNANNEISKKFFNKKIIKNYNNTAYASIINHKKNINNKALQIFTKFGPIAFLPISKTQTSVVYSIDNEKMNNLKFNQESFKKIIHKYNKFYKINFIGNYEKFDLKLLLSKNYFYKNILNFGDGIHQIHPLAGQGFNMTIRDLIILRELINNKLDLGLPLDCSIYEDFEKRTKHLNFLFASSIDLILQFFSIDNSFFKNYSKKIFNFLNKNKSINDLIIKYADRGL